MAVMEVVAMAVPFRNPLSVNVPLLVMGEPLTVRPKVGAANATLVTVPTAALAWNVGAAAGPFEVRTKPVVALAMVETGDVPLPIMIEPVATVDVPMPPLDTTRTPPKVMVPFVVMGLPETVIPVAPPLRPTLVTVPVPGVNARLIVIGAPAPLSVSRTGDVALNIRELGSAAVNEPTVTKDMPLTEPAADPKGSAEMLPVVVRLVVPAWTIGTVSSPVRGLAPGSDEMGILDIRSTAPARGGR